MGILNFEMTKLIQANKKILNHKSGPTHIFWTKEVEDDVTLMLLSDQYHAYLARLGELISVYQDHDPNDPQQDWSKDMVMFKIQEMMNNIQSVIKEYRQL